MYVYFFISLGIKQYDKCLSILKKKLKQTINIFH